VGKHTWTVPNDHRKGGHEYLCRFPYRSTGMENETPLMPAVRIGFLTSIVYGLDEPCRRCTISDKPARPRDASKLAMAEHEDDELNRLRSIFAHAHEQREAPSPKVIQRVVAQVRALLKKKTVADRIKPKRK
jgi:hypothetical protein